MTLLLCSLAVSWLAQVGTGGPLTWLHGRLAAYRAVWPQGWSFFTGMADQDVVLAYAVGPDGVLGSPENQRTAWSDRWWGLTDSGDSQALEISDLASQVPERYWKPCKSPDPSFCRVPVDPAQLFSLANRTPSRRLCGVTAFVVERPAPTVGGHLSGYPWVGYRLTVVDLECSG